MPARPSTVSLPSPGFQTKVSSPRPARHVVATPAIDEVVAGAADDAVVAVAAVDREVDLAGIEPGGVDGVVAGASINDKRVQACFGTFDRDLRRQSVDDNRRTAADDVDGVVADAAIDGHAIGRAVAHTTAGVPQRGRC